MGLPSTVSGLASGGAILVNAARQAAFGPDPPSSFRIVTLPATAIAENAIGRPIPNVPLLGAFLGLTELIPLSALFEAIEDRFKPDVAARNRDAAEAAGGAIEVGATDDGSHYVFDYDFCKGCGLCAQECPTGFIAMVEEWMMPNSVHVDCANYQAVSQ